MQRGREVDDASRAGVTSLALTARRPWRTTSRDTSSTDPGTSPTIRTTGG